MSKKWMPVWIGCLVAVAVAWMLPTLGFAQDLDMGNASTSGQGGGMGLWTVITSSGWLGIIIWIALVAISIVAAWLIIDFYITINPKRIIPEALVNDVRTAMEEGDLMKAVHRCETEPGTLSFILQAGFRNVKEGFEAVQEQVGVQADLESEKLMQRVSYLNMWGAIAPMVGLLGTVQGMIYAFANLGTTEAGAAQQSMLALNIAQALWTTAAGLCTAIPAIAFYTYFKNLMSRIILNMEGMTVDLIKSLRNVEVVEE